MSIDNALSGQYLERYPVEAARVLEQVSAKHVAALFSSLEPELVTPVLQSMLPHAAANCLEAMQLTNITRLITALPASAATRLYRLISPEQQKELEPALPDKVKKQIQRHLVYPPASAGALMSTNIDVLPETISVAEAIRRIDRSDHPVSCEIYITDDTHHLAGSISLGSLMKSKHHVKLSDIINRKVPSVYTHTAAEQLLSSPQLANRLKLPVLERDGTLSGELSYSRVKEIATSKQHRDDRDPLDLAISLAGLYWLSVAQFLDNLFGPAGNDKGERS